MGNANLIIGDVAAARAATVRISVCRPPITLGLIETIAFTDGGVDGTHGHRQRHRPGGMSDTINADAGHNLILR